MNERSINVTKFDVKTIAQRLGVSSQTIYREVKRGAITHRRLGKNRILFDETHIREYEENRLRVASAEKNIKAGDSTDDSQTEILEAR